MNPALRFDNVTITYPNGCCAVRDVRFALAAGECLALVGESGCGKTTMAKAVLGLLPRGTKSSGSIRVNTTEVIGATEATLRGLRGLQAGYVAQEPFSACDPLRTVGDHLAEAWRVHGLRPPGGAVEALLTKLGIVASPEQFPHQWSGGMLQRAVIAAAAAHQPPIIIADEPTSALDAELADAIVSSLRATGAALLLITHDLQLAARHANRIAICCDGQIVEIGNAAQVLTAPKHPYAISLCDAAQRIPQPTHALAPDVPVIAEARRVSKIWGRGAGAVTAVADVSLQVRRGEIVGIGGASGCGKSTLLRLLATMDAPSGGSVWLNGSPQPRRDGFVMPIFQDASGSLDRRWPVWRSVTEPLLAAHRREKPARSARQQIARANLNAVGLHSIDLEARPEELSVGQCQRIAIARALLAQPSLLIADEPTSALDAATTNEILRLFLQAAEQGAGLVLVSHDQTMLKQFCHRVLIMRAGQLDS
jgi:peptide/nickel transport system ATP-binding protein